MAQAILALWFSVKTQISYWVKTNQTKVDLRQWAGWQQTCLHLQYLLEGHYLTYLFSLSIFPWIWASLSLLIFSLSWCLEASDKSSALQRSFMLRTHIHNKLWMRLDIRIHLQQKLWWSWSCSKESWKWDGIFLLARLSTFSAWSPPLPVAICSHLASWLSHFHFGITSSVSLSTLKRKTINLNE